MNNKAISIVDGVIKIGGKEVELQWPIVQALKHHGLIIVRVEPPVGEIFNRNIFGLDADGEVVWQIEESPHGGGIDRPYMNILINENDELIASNWNGIDYIVSLDNGSVQVKTFNK